MVVNDSKKSLKISQKYCCVLCDYNTSKKTDHVKHLSTDKHKIATNGSKMVVNDSKKSLKVAIYTCLCGKTYKYDSGYYRHKKICTYQQTSETYNQQTSETYNQQTIDIQNKQHELIIELIKDNKEIKDFMMEQNKQIIELAKLAGHNTTNSHNTNKFNINFFLNEKCKDALNINDFVSQLEVGIQDLEETGRLGFSEGISKIFINGLKQIELYKRPLHCNDAKREILYIKNEDKWEKENEEKSILTKAIKEVAHKNIKKISEWQKVNKQYSDPDSKQNDKYLQIVSEAMSGASREESEKNYEKIVKNLVKETIIPNTEK
jgi:hypothetical protein